MGLFLDTAYFPGTQQAIDAAHAVNADGWAGYIFDPYLPNGNGGWTPDAVKAILDAGLGFLPIYVPGNSPLDPGKVVEILQSYGFVNGDIVIDIEGGSDPGVAYVNNWCDVVKAAGYRAGVYGTEGTVATDANHADFVWIADYLYKSVQPGLAPNPPGFNTEWFKDARAWQYANSFNVAGVDVDASTSNIQLDTKSNMTGGRGTVGQVLSFNPEVSGSFIGTVTAYDWDTLVKEGRLIQTGNMQSSGQYGEAVQLDGKWYDHIMPGNWCCADQDFNTFNANDPANTPDKIYAQQQASNQPAPTPAPAPQPAPAPSPAPAPQPAVDLQPVLDAVSQSHTEFTTRLANIESKLDTLIFKINAAGKALDA